MQKPGRLRYWVNYRLHPTLKGTVHQKFFYRSSLIFWIVMRSGIADLGERGLSDIAVKTHCTMGILGNKKFFLNLVTRSNLIQKPYYTLLKTFF